jgi:hypothetical protein
MNERLKQFWKYLLTTPSERKSITYYPLRIIIILAFFFFILLPLVLLFGLAFLNFPWLFAIGIFCAIGFAFISFLWGLIIRKVRYQAWNASSWVFRIFVAFWAWAFIFPVSFGPLTNWTLLKNITGHLQVPLAMPNGIAIDSKDNIYLSIIKFQRIQVYDKNGKFIKGWSASIGHSGRNHRFFVDEQDRLHVLSNFNHAVYETNGELLSINEVYNSERHKDRGANNPRLAKDRDGNIYEFEDQSESESFNSLYSRVIKTTRDGQQSIFITDPLPLWLIKANFPAFGFMMLSMIPAGLFGWLAKKAKKAQ